MLYRYTKYRGAGRGAGLFFAIAVAGFMGLATPMVHGQAATKPPLLQGPKVDVRKVPGVQERYLADDVGGVRNREEPIPLPVFFEMLSKLGQESGSASAGLDENQRAQIERLAEEMREDVQRYIALHTQEVKGLIAQLPQEKQRRASQTFGSLERIAKLLDRVVQSKELSGKRTRQKMMQQKRPNRHAAEGRKGDRKGDRRFRLHIGEPNDNEREQGQNEKAQPMDADRMMPMHKMQLRDMQGTQDGDEMASGDAITQLEALWQTAPSAATLQTRVWMLLRQDQQDTLSRTLEIYQQKRRAEREQARLERDIARRKGAQKKAPNPNRINRSVDDVKTAQSGKGGRADQARRSIDIDPALLDRALRELQSGKISEQLWKRLPEKVRTWLLRLPENRRAEALRTFLESYKSGVFDKTKNR